jgi:hypothetical protein
MYKVVKISDIEYHYSSASKWSLCLCNVYGRATVDGSTVSGQEA